MGSLASDTPYGIFSILSISSSNSFVAAFVKDAFSLAVAVIVSIRVTSVS
jgi:hypothetical protein